MKKAKALFTAGIIVIVAGASAVGLYLNDSGKLDFGEDESVLPENNIIQNVVDKNENGQNFEDSNADEYESENVQTETEDNNIDVNEDYEDVDVVSLNEFLSTFSRLYFAQNRDYNKNNADSYELLKFAYLYAEVFENRNSVVTEFFDDEIGVYNGIKASDAQRIIDKFFGITVAEQSVYTEKTYQFFMYRDGYFYTPAADGVGFTDIAITDSAIKSDDMISVSFTVYSDGVSTDMTSAQAKKNGIAVAGGTAQICVENGEYRLISYCLEMQS